MQVIVKEEPVQRNDNHRMQLVFQNRDHNSFSSSSEAQKSHNLALKGRGKDSFFLLAQDTDSASVIRDSRRVPTKILKQVSSSSRYIYCKKNSL